MKYIEAFFETKYIYCKTLSFQGDK